jgi:hypothetical protein
MVAFISTVWSRSNMAREWCALAAAQDSARERPKANNRMIFTRASAGFDSGATLPEAIDSPS